MTPTPEPGQPVWIAAEVVPSVAGHPMLTPITADGQPSAIRLAAARYRWYPADVPPQPESPANPRRLYWALRGLVEAVEKNAASLDHDAVRSALEAISAEDERYAQWSPDVPPQPPVLAEGMPVRIADDPSPWEIHTIAVKEQLGWWSATVRLKPDLGATRARRATAAAAPLADVHGPDDTTPTPEPAEAQTGAQPWRLAFICCGREDGTKTFATRDEAEAFREGYTSGPGVDPHGYSAAYPNGHQRAAILTYEGDQAPEPQPTGEGAALIAATEQEIARITDCPEAMDAWEATARRLADEVDRMRPVVEAAIGWRPNGMRTQARRAANQALSAAVDAYQAPVQATTHGEAGEAPETAQGAGRDWFAAVLEAIGPVHQFTIHERLPEVLASRVVAALAALGLHDLEQAAAELCDARTVLRKISAGVDTSNATCAADVADAVIRDRNERILRVSALGHEGIAKAVAELDARGEALAKRTQEALRLKVDRDNERVWRERAERQRDEARAEVAQWQAAYGENALRDATRIIADRAAARRELEQLRGEVEAVAHKLAAFSSCYFGCHKAAHANAGYLRSLAAAAAPATQDGDPK